MNRFPYLKIYSQVQQRHISIKLIYEVSKLGKNVSGLTDMLIFSISHISFRQCSARNAKVSQLHIYLTYHIDYILFQPSLDK